MKPEVSPALESFGKTGNPDTLEAFALAGGTWSLGSILGPIIGGGLSHPVERYPALFGSFSIFQRWVRITSLKRFYALTEHHR